MATDYVFSERFSTLEYRNIIIARNLTNRLSSVLPEAMNELIMAFEENTNIGRGMYKYTSS